MLPSPIRSKNGSVLKVVRQSKRLRYLQLVVGALFFALVLGFSPRIRAEAGRDPYLRFMLPLAAVAVIFLVCNVSFARLEATEDGIECYNFLNHRRFKVSYRDLTSYEKIKGNWKLFAGERQLGLPEIELAALHALIAERAAHALKVRVLSWGNLPPEEPIDASVMDRQYWLAQVLSGTVLFLPLLFLKAALSAIFVAYWRSLLQLCDVCGRIRLDSEGITIRWPGWSRTIAWQDVTTVFCEGEGANRYFVIAGGGEAVEVPRHLSQDFLFIQKMFFSLPPRTRYVNFDRSFTSGRRRKRKKEKAKLQLELQPGF